MHRACNDCRLQAFFFSARTFRIHLGNTLEMPEDVLLSENWYKQHWTGPRRLKNAIVLLEWIPSLRDLAAGAHPYQEGAAPV